jgi:hypothetical protein
MFCVIFFATIAEVAGSLSNTPPSSREPEPSDDSSHNLPPSSSLSSLLSPLSAPSLSLHPHKAADRELACVTTSFLR